MRLGILLGFLVGAAVASYLASQESAESDTPSLETGDTGLVAKLKHQAEEARAAARQASEEKQAEMLRDWERSRQAQHSDTE